MSTRSAVAAGTRMAVPSGTNPSRTPLRSAIESAVSTKGYDRLKSNAKSAKEQIKGLAAGESEKRLLFESMIRLNDEIAIPQVKDITFADIDKVLTEEAAKLIQLAADPNLSDEKAKEFLSKLEMGVSSNDVALASLRGGTDPTHNPCIEDGMRFGASTETVRVGGCERGEARHAARGHSRKATPHKPDSLARWY